MANPRVSIIMPAYNSGNYIPTAIQSILSQTFTDYEFIIIDDSSTDTTWRLIQKYAIVDKRIIALHNKSNLKLCKTLNRGIEIAKGKYVVRMDSDDWSYPDRLQKQYNYMELHNDVVISGGSMVVCDNNLHAVAKRTYSNSDRILRSSIFRYSPFSHPTVIMRTDILKNVGGYETLYAEDIELYFKLGKYGKFGNIPDELIKYRDTPNSMTNSKLKITEIHTIQHRMNAIIKLGYTASILDYIYNFLQFLSIYVFPANMKIWLFNKLRNTSINK